jgi:transcriptional regulator with XRE-family HTH domain
MADSTNAQTALGRRLRDEREAKGWSRETLGRKSNTTPLTILRAEVHGSQPTLTSLAAWADALGVPVSDFLLPDPEAAA